jgi:hypothetical protein
MTSPFSDLPELPCDVAEALEQFKLAIIRHKSMDWGMIGQDELLDVCRALTQFVEGEPELLDPIQSDQVQYQPEYRSVRKDFIYAAIGAIESALGYMPLIKTEVPQWNRQLSLDIRNMESAIEQLRSDEVTSLGPTKKTPTSLQNSGPGRAPL